MTSSEITDNNDFERQKERKVSPVLLSLVIALVLALAAGYYVHLKNERVIKTETTTPNKEPNHAN